ncbi:glycosyltransferase family 2 protein [Phocaeicola sp.]
MKLLTIIVTYNAMQWADRCLQSLQHSTVATDVYVVDNGSKDGTQAYIQKHYSYVMFRQSAENLGFGQANNMGLQYALNHSYDYVYLLNQDAWVMPDTFEKLMAINQQQPEFGVLSPFQLQGNGTSIDMNFAWCVCGYKSNPYLINDLYFQRLQEVYEVPDVMAAHWLISRACLKKVGGFSPTFPHYGEDNNYAQRVMYHGFKLGIVPGTTAIHDRENRALLTKKQIFYRVYISILILLSNIYEPVKYPLLRAFGVFCISAIRHAAPGQLKYQWKIWCGYRFIRRNNEISRGEGAFLTQALYL